MPELDSEMISGRGLVIGNPTAFFIAARKFSKTTEFRVCTRVSVFMCQVFSLTELSILGNHSCYFRGYDAGKSFIWGSTEEQKKASFLAMFAFAQFATSISETLAYPLTTIRRRLMIESGKSLD